jgi:hypothetical protein
MEPFSRVGVVKQRRPVHGTLLQNGVLAAMSCLRPVNRRSSFTASEEMKPIKKTRNAIE